MSGHRLRDARPVALGTSTFGSTFATTASLTAAAVSAGLIVSCEQAARKRAEKTMALVKIT